MLSSKKFLREVGRNFYILDFVLVDDRLFVVFEDPRRIVMAINGVKRILKIFAEIMLA